MFDAHCHLDLSEDTASEDWLSAHQRGVRQAVLAGVDSAGWQRQALLCRKHACLVRTAGLHPWAVARMTAEELKTSLEALTAELELKDAQLVGVGELGLDRSHQLKQAGGLQYAQQIQAFEAQAALALELQLPVVLHVVRSQGHALDLMRSLGSFPAGGMVHAFSGSKECAEAWLKQGFHISIHPQICSPRAQRVRSVAQMIPSDRLLVETDSPDQAPSPANLIDVIRAVASARSQTPDFIAKITADNARRLFGLSSIA